MEHYTIIKKELLKHSVTWLSLKDIRLSEINCLKGYILMLSQIWHSQKEKVIMTMNVSVVFQRLGVKERYDYKGIAQEHFF